MHHTDAHTRRSSRRCIRRSIRTRGRESGPWPTSVPHPTAKPGQHPKELVAAFHAAVDQIAKDGITERELTQVKNGVRAELLDRMSSVLGKADQLNMYNYYTATPDDHAQDLARYEKLTTSDVQRAARQYLAGKNKVVLTVVPQGKKELAVSGGTN